MTPAEVQSIVDAAIKAQAAKIDDLTNVIAYLSGRPDPIPTNWDEWASTQAAAMGLNGGPEKGLIKRVSDLEASPPGGIGNGARVRIEGTIEEVTP